MANFDEKFIKKSSRFDDYFYTSLSGAYAYEGVWVRFGVCGNMSVHCNSEHLVIEKPFITANHKKNTLFMMRNGAFLEGQCRYLLQVVRYSLNAWVASTFTFW